MEVCHIDMRFISQDMLNLQNACGRNHSETIVILEVLVLFIYMTLHEHHCDKGFLGFDCHMISAAAVLSTKWDPGGHLDIKISSYQYRDPHVKD